MNNENTGPVLPDEVRAELERLVESGVLGKQSRLPALMRHIVTEELEGRGDKLKAYTIGIDVLGRSADFDPNNDSIVRVEMKRLRQALEHYYATTGAGAALAITIPSGSYRPEFVRDAAATASAIAGASSAAIAKSELASSRRLRHLGLLAALGAVVLAGALTWAYGIKASAPGPALPVVAAIDPDKRFIKLIIEPVRARTSDPQVLGLSDGIRAQLAVAMTQVRSFKVAAVSPLAQAQGVSDGSMLFHLTIDLQNERDTTRIIASLTDPSGQLFWAQTYSYDTPLTEIMSIQDRFVQNLMSDLRPKIAAAAKRELVFRGGTSASAWEAYLKATWVAGSDRSTLAATKQRIADARVAVSLSPDFGQAHAVLAEKLAHITSIDPASDSEELRAEALGHARKAVELEPGDPEVIYNVATYHWHFGHNDMASQFMERTLELDPYFPTAAFFAPIARYTCMPPPPEVLKKAIAQDAALSPNNPFRWMTQTWIALLAVNAGDWDLARKAAAQSIQFYVTPDNVLRNAAILARDGRKAEALAQVDRLRPNWPTLDLAHFARETIAKRRCSEGNPPQGLLEMYEALAALSGGS